MHGDVECHPLITPAENTGHQDQVARTRDRQKLGQSLNDAKNDRPKNRHRGSVVDSGAAEGDIGNRKGQTGSAAGEPFDVAADLDHVEQHAL